MDGWVAFFCNPGSELIAILLRSGKFHIVCLSSIGALVPAKVCELGWRRKACTATFDDFSDLQYQILPNYSELHPIASLNIGKEFQSESSASKTCYPDPRTSWFDERMLVQHFLHTVQHDV